RGSEPAWPTGGLLPVGDRSALDERPTFRSEGGGAINHFLRELPHFLAPHRPVRLSQGCSLERDACPPAFGIIPSPRAAVNEKRPKQNAQPHPHRGAAQRSHSPSGASPRRAHKSACSCTSSASSGQRCAT